MKTWFSWKQAIALFLTTLWLWMNIIPSAEAWNNNHPEFSTQIVAVTPNLVQQASETNWYEIDQKIAKAVRKASACAEDFAKSELDHWESQLIKRIDQNFLNWYFDFLHQKATEFGVPFAWLVFQLDSVLKILRSQDEKDLSADQIIERRMLEEFNQKFSEMVLNQEAGEDLKEIVQRVGQNFTSALGIQLNQVQARYKVGETDWNYHLEQISKTIYNSGSHKYSLKGSDLTMNLMTVAFAVTTAAVGSKIAVNLATKATSKLVAKGAASVAAKWGTSLLDPAFALGIIAWDIWDYQTNVAKSRPQLRSNLIAYLDELKGSILENAEGNGILDAIAGVQEDFLEALTLS